MARQADYLNSMTYRKLDENGDYMLGVQGNMLSGLDAITQAIKTRLRTVYGEWFQGDPTALDYFGGILGQKTISNDALDLDVINRIMDTIGVLSVYGIQSSLVGRVYRFSCNVKTVYGDTTAEVTT